MLLFLEHEDRLVLVLAVLVLRTGHGAQLQLQRSQSCEAFATRQNKKVVLQRTFVTADVCDVDGEDAAQLEAVSAVVERCAHEIIEPRFLVWISAAFGAVLSQAFSKNESAKEIPEQLSLQLLDSEAAV